MEAPPIARQTDRMKSTTITGTVGLSNGLSGRGVRRLVGLERKYRCSAAHEHHSWARLRACPECGEQLTVAVIHRAALATG
jgi:hypothetical protein